MARKKEVKKVEDIRRFREINVNDFSIIIKPHLTEKSMKLLQEENKVTVVVKEESNKLQIKEAFEALFNVKVEKISVINTRPQSKRIGKFTGIVPGFKKAIVKLANGEALDLFKDAE
ncbi:MAG: 50S ribosomal protein L23 [Bacillales bacterium]|nr:50S ribosomal protein L23 [Bacillales bacterium]